ncbi:MAG: hypothetical protein ABIJ83_00905 [Patescibacteria group bacterium]
MGTTEKLIKAQKETSNKIAEIISENKPDENLTRWTKMMAITIIIQTVTLIVINLLK